MKNMHAAQNVKVHLTGPFWKEKQKLFCDEVLERQWRILNSEEETEGFGKSHCIDNFRILAGDMEGKFWGYVFLDHELGKWMEAAAYSLMIRPDPTTMERMEYLVDLLRRAQREDGYLNTYYSLQEPGMEWTNIRHGHELLNAGNFLEAAIAWYAATGKHDFLDIIIKNIDLICDKVYTADHYIYPGHEELEIALIKLYLLEGNEKYLDLAKRFVDTRGVGHCFFEDEGPIFDMGLSYYQAHKPVREQDSAVGHAVRASYLYTAMAELGHIFEDETLFNAARVLWDDIAQKKLYIIGGIGSEEHDERFTVPYDLPNAYSYSETCASIGLVMFARAMLKEQPDAAVADVMERAVYNCIMAGISFDGRAYFYVNPLEMQPEVAKYRFDHTSIHTQREEWMICPCCPPNLLRFILSLQEYVYTFREDGTYVNMLLSNRVQFLQDGHEQAFTLDGNEPWDGAFRLTAETDLTKPVFVKIPYWCENHTVTKNGQALACTAENGYLVLEQLCAGDVIGLDFSLRPRFVYSDPRVMDDSGKAAVERGYIVYCAEQTDNGADLSALTVDDNAQPEDLLDEQFGGIRAVTLKGARLDATGTGLYTFSKPRLRPVDVRLIPYALWGNRGEGEMIVWFKTHTL